MAALARWCYRHRLVVLLLWVGALFGLGFSASTAGTDYANVFSLPDTDSKKAYDLMEKAFPARRATPTRWCGRSTGARYATRRCPPGSSPPSTRSRR